MPIKYLRSLIYNWLLLTGKEMDELTKILMQIQKDIAIIKNDLNHHIKRTDLNEENIRLIKEDLSQSIVNSNKILKNEISLLELEVKPVRRHVIMMEGALKLLGILSVVSSLVFTIYKFF